MKLAALLLEMGSTIEAEVDPDKGEVLLLLQVKVEDARRLAPCLLHRIGIDVLMREKKSGES